MGKPSTRRFPANSAWSVNSFLRALAERDRQQRLPSNLLNVARQQRLPGHVRSLKQQERKGVTMPDLLLEEILANNEQFLQNTRLSPIGHAPRKQLAVV